jgi:hypothetical protein
MARGVRRGEEQGQSRARSTSRGRVVVLRGWRKGMDKAGVTLLLRDSGVPLADAHAATESILRGEPANVCLPKGTKVAEVRRELARLGVIL